MAAPMEPEEAQHDVPEPDEPQARELAVQLKSIVRRMPREHSTLEKLCYIQNRLFMTPQLQDLEFNYDVLYCTIALINWKVPRLHWLGAVWLWVGHFLQDAGLIVTI